MEFAESNKESLELVVNITDVFVEKPDLNYVGGQKEPYVQSKIV